jgi:hypothetical protein
VELVPNILAYLRMSYVFRSGHFCYSIRLRLPYSLAMDVDRCVALHNKIFKHGWFESGRTIEEFERECKTWFSLWGDEAEALRNTFSPELVAFLERAYAVGIGHSFFWYVEGLDYPTGLFEAAHCFNEASDDDDPARYIVLYHMNNHGESHVVGLL